MIKKATWDSNFFNFPIGFLRINEKTEWNLDKFIAESKKYKLVYIFSDIKLEQNSYFKLVDRKVTYSKKLIAGTNPKKDIIDFDRKYHKYSDLLDLGYLSGTFSRFKLDNNFTEENFSRLYKKWIDKSLNGEIAFKVFVKIELNEIAGFVTLQEKSFQTSQIGLVAVNPEFQGRNIATDLIQKCELASLSNGYINLEVSTQYNNMAARKLYQKNEFEIKSMEYIYHLWNQ